MAKSTVTITHWLPIITFCPVNGMPDLIFVEVSFNSFIELYKVRKAIREALQWEKLYMEDCADVIYTLFPNASHVKVRLMFNKHVVELEK